MTVRNVRTRNWNPTAASASNGSARSIRRAPWNTFRFRIVVVAVLLLAFVGIFICYFRTTHTDRRAINDHQYPKSSPSLSLHRWYTDQSSFLNRYRHAQDHHIPIHSLLYHTYQQKQLQLQQKLRKKSSPPSAACASPAPRC